MGGALAMLVPRIGGTVSAMPRSWPRATRLLALAVALAVLTAAAVIANVALLGLGIGSDHPVGQLGPSIAQFHPARAMPLPSTGRRSTLPPSMPAVAPRGAEKTGTPAATTSASRKATPVPPPAGARPPSRGAETTKIEGLDDDD